MNVLPNTEAHPRYRYRANLFAFILTLPIGQGPLASGLDRQEYARPSVVQVASDAKARAPVRPFGPARQVTRIQDLPDARFTRGAIRSFFDDTVLREVANGQAGRFELPVGTDESLIAVISHVRHRGHGTYTLIGTLQDREPSEVLLVFHHGVLSGYASLFAERRHFEISMPAGKDVVVRLSDDEALNAECGTDDAWPGGDEVQPGKETVAEPAGAAGVPGSAAGDTVMDIVVGYGRDARQSEGGTAQMQAKIVAAVDRMNTCFDHSGITGIELVLLGTIEDPDYDYPGDISGSMGSSDELGDLNSHGDGSLDAVSQLRMDLGADLNTFVIDGVDGSAGIAYRPGRSAVVARTYMTSSRITFVHELGHNIGCRHAWGDTDCGTSARNYGWRLLVGSSEYRTVMAYDWGWQRITYFSNPSVYFSGSRTGAVDGYDATGDSSADPRLVSGGLDGTCTTGFDGSHPSLGGNNAQYIMDRARYVEDNAVRAALAVTDPAGGLALAAGETHTIRWVGGIFGDTVNIDLYRAGTFVRSLATGVANSDRSEAWTVPSDVPGADDYRIRVEINGGASAFSSSFQIYSEILECSVSSLSPNCLQWQDAASDTFEVWNGGVDVMSYTVSADEPWLSVTPGSGTSAGEHDVIVVDYDTSALAPGEHTAWIVVESPGTYGSPRSIRVTLVLIPAATLTVATPHGIPTPAEGIYTNASGTVLTNSVTSPDTQGTTQYVCTGWVMTGNAPGTGSTSVMVMTHTSNAELTWQWNTNFWLDTELEGVGTVSPPDGWRARGEEVPLAAVPDPYAYFDGWSGAGTAMITAGDIHSTNVTVTMTSAAELTAGFKAILLAIDSIKVSNQCPVLAWSALPGFSYGVERATVPPDTYHEIADYLPGTPPTNIYADLAAPATEAFYRINMSTWSPPDGLSLVSAATFQMGDSLGDDTGGSELPVHPVKLGTFFVEPHEVTKALWDEVYAWAVTHGYAFENAGTGKGDDHPVYLVNWYDCVKWCNARSEKEGLPPVYYLTSALAEVYRTGQTDAANDAVDWDARGYRLPTEAEWEMASRGGVVGMRYPWGDTIGHTSANYRSVGSYDYDVSATSGYHPTYFPGVFPYTAPVGSFAPNSYGLYDVVGNVWEFCWDWYDAYPSGTVTNPVGPASGSYRLVRGGSFNLDANVARCSKRSYMNPRYAYFDGGFRCVIGF